MRDPQGDARAHAAVDHGAGEGRGTASHTVAVLKGTTITAYPSHIGSTGDLMNISDRRLRDLK